MKEKGDLALCFRGNESEKGTVTIYKHNHCIWTIKIVEGIPKVYISLDHARFMENWDINVVKRLMEIGFHTANKASYSELSEAGLLATMVGSNKDGRYNYHAIELFVEIDSNKERTKNIVDKSFVLLNEIQNSFFNEKKP